ncbi:MAG: alpha/beta hydrolase fold domain-containing protein [Thermodesulfobacteriota bacterium]
MKRNSPYWFLLLSGMVLLIQATSVHAGRYRDEIFPTVAVTKDIVYGAADSWDGQPCLLKLDLYQPEGDTASSRAAIVWIHGGGFVGGDKGEWPFLTLATRFAKRGYFCVSINYRLVTPSQFAADPVRSMNEAMYDAKAAVRWLRANAALCRIDPQRIAIGGGSAGAYTSLHTAYLEEEGSSGSPGYSSEVKAVIDFWGGMVQYSAMESSEAPLMIIHGTADPIVPFINAQMLVQQATAVGIPYEFHPLEGVGHSAWNDMEQYITWISPFLYTHVIAKPSIIPCLLLLWE